MGIGGHMLGPKKLRQLNEWSGINFQRAYNRNGSGEGRVVNNGVCIAHYQINFKSKHVRLCVQPRHWSSCHTD